MALHFNGLTPAEAERLAILAEEASEVVHAVTKVLRHGFESFHPDEPKGPTNREKLALELGNLEAAVYHCVKAQDVQAGFIHIGAASKMSSNPYTHHQQDKDNEPNGA